MTNKLKLEPMGKNVIIKPVKIPDKTDSGIYIPETASKEKPQRGEVMAIGPLVKSDENFKNLKVGNFVYFSKYAGDEIKVDDIDYKIISSDSLLAKEI